MFTIETLLAFVDEIPAVMDIVVRYWHELATYTIGILSNML